MPLKLSHITFKKHRLAEGMELVEDLLQSSEIPSFASMQHANVQFGNRWSVSIIRNMPKPTFPARWKLVYEVAAFSPNGVMHGPWCFDAEDQVEKKLAEIMAAEPEPAPAPGH